MTEVKVSDKKNPVPGWARRTHPWQWWAVHCTPTSSHSGVPTMPSLTHWAVIGMPTKSEQKSNPKDSHLGKCRHCHHFTKGSFRSEESLYFPPDLMSAVLSGLSPWRSDDQMNGWPAGGRTLQVTWPGEWRKQHGILTFNGTRDAGFQELAC